MSVTSGCKRAPSKSTPKRPNFLIIQVDDLGYDDLGLHGNPYLSTPYLDKLG
ncbi:MAG: sulfatase-like hydrolase/transferase [Mameliella sp.]|nr:sulfatase-like hydrolase/transferase [Phaeodactylibacter sp.]